MTQSQHLTFAPDSYIFLQFKALWKDQVGEELTYEYAQKNPRLLALIGAVARWKQHSKVI